MLVSHKVKFIQVKRLFSTESIATTVNTDHIISIHPSIIDTSKVCPKTSVLTLSNGSLMKVEHSYEELQNLVNDLYEYRNEN